MNNQTTTQPNTGTVTGNEYDGAVFSGGLYDIDFILDLINDVHDGDRIAPGMINKYNVFHDLFWDMVELIASTPLS